MARIISVVTGAGLVLMGGLWLGYTLLAARFAWPVPAPWRLWPLATTAVGLMCLLPLVLAPRQRRLAVLFLPGLPLLIVGGLAMLTLFLPAGFVWATFWPQIVLALALGWGLAAIYGRTIWLIVPAAVLGALGAALQFSTATGWWSAWGVLWAVVPLALGFALMVIGRLRRERGLRLAGLLLCLVTGLGGAGLGALLSGNWNVVSASGGLLLIGGGAALAGLSLKPERRPADQTR